MATSYRDLKKSREAMFAALNNQIETQGKKGGGRPENDPRFWYPSVDTSGNGYAVIRFLPAPQGEAVPYVLEYAHGFKGPGGWYIQKSLTTLGKGHVDPVGEYNRAQWAKSEAAGNEHLKKDIQEGCKRRKRNTSYVANILVVRDPQNPENEGKVFLFRYGLKIQGMIETKIKPEFPGEVAMNAFDPWDGADLKLKITTNAPTAGQKKGFRNYDKSEWAQPAAIGTDADIEALWKQEYPLQPIIAADQFESYDVLKAMFDRVMGFTQKAAEQSVAETPKAEARQPKATVPWEDEAAVDTDDGDDADDLEKFRRLAGMID